MGKIAVLFSGQGAQYPGMMKDIVHHSASAEKVYREADASLNRSISFLSFSGNQEELNLTHNTQPCVLAADLAAFEALKETGIEADVFAGFSLGEYAALVTGNVIGLKEAFQVVQLRADYMQEAVPIGYGAMAALANLSLEEVQIICDEVNGYVTPANINCPGQIVISGETEAVLRAVDKVKENGKKALVLPVSAPFHCALLEPAAKRLEKALNEMVFRDAEKPLYMNVDGEKECSGVRIKRKLVLQAKSPVYWETTLRNMYSDGVRVFVECGPGKTLSGFVKKTFRGFDDVVSLRVSDVDSLVSTVAYFEGVG